MSGASMCGEDSAERKMCEQSGSTWELGIYSPRLEQTQRCFKFCAADPFTRSFVVKEISCAAT